MGIPLGLRWLCPHYLPKMSKATAVNGIDQYRVALIDYMSEVRRIAFMSDKLYYYRHHPNSVMATPESEEVILTDFRTEKVAVSKIKSYFSCTTLEKSYIDRIVLEWESRLRNYSHLKEIKEFIERLKS